MTLLERILVEKRKEVDEAVRMCSRSRIEEESERAPPVRTPQFVRRNPGPPGVIAEMKRMSPSRGMIREPYDPVDLALRYRTSGAAALSILTDRSFFGGTLDDLKRVRESGAGEVLPILRKDFIIDPYQVFESRCAGADLVLLIVRILSGKELASLIALIHGLGMTALVEAHIEEEVLRALDAGARLVGVNHRDLDTLATDLDRGERLASLIPSDVARVAESGLKTFSDYRRMEQLGFDAVLVGESFLVMPDPGKALEDFCGHLG